MGARQKDIVGGAWPENRLFRFPRYLGTRKRRVDLEPSDEREERIFRTINLEW